MRQGSVRGDHAQPETVVVTVADQSAMTMRIIVGAALAKRTNRTATVIEISEDGSSVRIQYREVGHRVMTRWISRAELERDWMELPEAQ
jgi:hypothetical protein